MKAEVVATPVIVALVTVVQLFAGTATTPVVMVIRAMGTK